MVSFPDMDVIAQRKSKFHLLVYKIVLSVSTPAFPEDILKATITNERDVLCALADLVDDNLLEFDGELIHVIPISPTPPEQKSICVASKQRAHRKVVVVGKRRLKVFSHQRRHFPYN